MPASPALDSSTVQSSESLFVPWFCFSPLFLFPGQRIRKRADDEQERENEEKTVRKRLTSLSLGT